MSVKTENTINIVEQESDNSDEFEVNKETTTSFLFRKININLFTIFGIIILVIVVFLLFTFVLRDNDEERKIENVYKLEKLEKSNKILRQKNKQLSEKKKEQKLKYKQLKNHIKSINAETDGESYVEDIEEKDNKIADNDINETLNFYSMKKDDED